MDEEEKLTSKDLESETTYALVNAIEPDKDSNFNPSPTTGDDESQTISPSLSPRSGSTDDSNIFSDQHREYTNPSVTLSSGSSSSVPEQHAHFDVSTLPQGSSLPPPTSSRRTAPALNYGTFRDRPRKTSKGRPRKVVTFKVSPEHEANCSPDEGYTVKLSSTDASEISTFEIGQHDIRIEDACLLTKEEVDHMCDDVSEFVRSKPDALHWRHIIMATVVMCPVCGIASAVFAYKSKRFYDTGQIVAAKRMLRHSDFCLRCATIFGIVFWFLVFLFLVVNKEKIY